MESPFDRHKGKIVDIGVDGAITIKVNYGDVTPLLQKKCKDTIVEFVDGRKNSTNQRKMVWSLIGAISNWMGSDKQETSKIMKDTFLSELGEDEESMFSLSNASMSIVSAYQDFLINFIVENGIQTDNPLVEYTDDIEKYVYQCLLNKKCAVCGYESDLHHYNRVGAGRDRKKINHNGMSVMPLCRLHHTECHTMPQKDFDELYHLVPCMVDEKISDLYGLNYFCD